MRQQRSFATPPSLIERYWLPALSLAIIGYLARWSASGLKVSWSRVASGVPEVLRIFRLMFPPNFEYLSRVSNGLMESLYMAILGTTIAAILAIPIGFLAAKNAARYPAVYSTGKLILNGIRTFPEILLAIIIMRGVGPGAFCGILAMGVHSIGMLGKLYSEAIEAIDPNPIEALTSTGASRLQVLWYAVLPQVLPEFASFALYRLEINMRSATVLGLVGAGGIGQMLSANLQFHNWSNVGLIMIGVILMVTTIDQISSRLRRKLV